jgi:hypothetical protein
MPIHGDDFEQRARLVSLVYGVLGNLETPADGATESAICLALSRAFADKAIALADPKPDAPKTGRASPTSKRRT